MPQDSEGGCGDGTGVARPGGCRAGALRGTCVAALGGVRLLLLASTTFVLAACNIGALGDPQTYQDTSPGMVTFQLDLPATRSYCDQIFACGGGPAHVTFTDAAGNVLQVDGSFCATDCSRCAPTPCPAIACIPGGSGQPVTQVQATWDGSFYQSATCGQGVSCTARHYVLPGRYKAHMCATPGTIGQGDAGMPTCTNTGPQQCVDVNFQLPGPPLIETSLPDATQ
jgi:hypothetical protein